MIENLRKMNVREMSEFLSDINAIEKVLNEEELRKQSKQNKTCNSQKGCKNANENANTKVDTEVKKTNSEHTMTKPYDMLTTTDSLLIRIAVPGYKPEEITVSYDNQLLTVNSNGALSEQEYIKMFDVVEQLINIGKFENKFKILKSIDDVIWSMEDGILEVQLKYSKPSKPTVKYVR